MGKRDTVNLHIQAIGNGEVRQTLASWRMFLGIVDLTLGTELGTPQARAPLQGTQHAAAARIDPDLNDATVQKVGRRR